MILTRPDVLGVNARATAAAEHRPRGTATPEHHRTNAGKITSHAKHCARTCRAACCWPTLSRGPRAWIRPQRFLSTPNRSQRQRRGRALVRRAASRIAGRLWMVFPFSFYRLSGPDCPDVARKCLKTRPARPLSHRNAHPSPPAPSRPLDEVITNHYPGAGVAGRSRSPVWVWGGRGERGRRSRELRSHESPSTKMTPRGFASRFL